MFTAFDMPYVDVCGGVPEVVWPCRSLQKWRGQWTDCPQEAARALPGSVRMRVLMARKRVLQQLDHIQIAVLCQDQMICLTMHTSTLCIQPNRFIVQEVIIATAAIVMPARCMLGDSTFGCMFAWRQWAAAATEYTHVHYIIRHARTFLHVEPSTATLRPLI